jgi:solute carrier family 25 protein 34/35
MVRNQLQSAAVKETAVGYQHHHESMSGALKKIYRAHGVSGLYRGVSVTVPRGMFGSGSQIAAFGYSKDLFQRHSHLDPTVISFLSGCVAGTTMALVMHPVDIISTRLYNQGTTPSGKGIYYSGVIDCLVKMIKTEGVRGLYKGFWPHYLRLGTHSVLVLLFFDELKALKARLKV